MKNLLLLILSTLLVSCAVGEKPTRSSRSTREGRSCNKSWYLLATHLSRGVIEENTRVLAANNLLTSEETDNLLQEEYSKFSNGKTCFSVTINSFVGLDAADSKHWVFKVKDSQDQVHVARLSGKRSPAKYLSGPYSRTYYSENTFCTSIEVDTSKGFLLYAIPQMNCSEPVIFHW